MSHISPDLAEEIFEFFSEEHSLEEFKKEFCADVSEYKGKVLVCMSCEFYRGGSWSEDVLLDKKDWRRFTDYTNVHLGEVNGKWSDVTRQIKDIVDEIIDDPYEISEYAEHHHVLQDYSVLHCTLQHLC